MGDSSLTWYNTKQSTLKKKITLNYASKNRSDLVCIPLKYICYSSKSIYRPKEPFLLIRSDEISFSFYPSSTSNLSTNYSLSFSDVKYFQYAEKNCLISLTTYRPINITDEILFKSTIWFCLDYKSYKEYSKLLESLTIIDICSIKFSAISHDSLDLFRKTMNKCVDSYQIEFVSDWEKYLLTNVNKKSDSISKEIAVYKGNKTCSKRKKDDFPLDIQQRSKVKKIEQKYVYCPSSSHSIEITSLDLVCLRPKVYINDNIINLYITYIFSEIMNDKQRERAHFFNCFFNTKLIGINKHSVVYPDTPEKRHERVAKWTKNVDIFDKDFLVIPVIESQHWFLVIVCFPWMAGIVDYTKLLAQPDSSSISNIPINNSEFATVTRHEKLAKMKEEDPDLDPLPCILVFDSLSFQKRTEKVNIIRDYLKSEWDAKRLQRDGPLIFDKTTVRGYCPKVPQQKNMTDCGVYLLHYLETFFKEPIKNFTVDFFKTFLAEWFNQSDVDKKRSHIRSTIENVVVKPESIASNDD